MSKNSPIEGGRPLGYRANPSIGIKLAKSTQEEIIFIFETGRLIDPMILVDRNKKPSWAHVALSWTSAQSPDSECKTASMENHSQHKSRAAEMAMIYEHKRTVTEKVRLHLAQFGDDVIAFVMAFALQPKRMPILFAKLNLKYPHDPETQLKSIKTYLAQRGRYEFLKRLKSDSKKLVAAADIDDICNGMEGAEKIAPIGSSIDSKVEAIKTVDYQDANRRVLPDRRRSDDRRADVEAITKNQRFGGDRRKVRRRKTE